MSTSYIKDKLTRSLKIVDPSLLHILVPFVHKQRNMNKRLEVQTNAISENGIGLMFSAYYVTPSFISRSKRCVS